ncbi:hypothetical protein GWK47_045674 [Chionoecetes opilio]|uniref:Uncharacterized protein n=1 Tax=Chionoecetes opilio TaxID=41210 RepID=A0A8J4YCQ0_CHIOP|nr:hypothetical protein GWK47_045674 [Chionoecetes opilio]
MEVSTFLLRLVVAVTALAESPAGGGRLPGDSVSSSPPSTVMARPFGYYADLDHGCRAFHLCSPVFTEEGELEEMAHFTFMCGAREQCSARTLSLVPPRLRLWPCSEATAHSTSPTQSSAIIPEEHPGIHEQALQ